MRAAVCEALQTAKTLASGCMIMDSEDGDHIGAGAKASELLKMTPQRRTWSSNKYSPSSQESYHMSFTPPNSTGDSDTSVHDSSTLSGMGSTARMKRSTLFPSSVAASEVLSRHGSLPHSCKYLLPHVVHITVNKVVYGCSIGFIGFSECDIWVLQLL